MWEKKKTFDVEYHQCFEENLCSYLCVWIGFKGFKYYR